MAGAVRGWWRSPRWQVPMRQAADELGKDWLKRRLAATSCPAIGRASLPDRVDPLPVDIAPLQTGLFLAEQVQIERVQIERSGSMPQSPEFLLSQVLIQATKQHTGRSSLLMQSTTAL